MEPIAQGAEAIIYVDGAKIIKDRIKKEYRISEIDTKLRKQRTKAEAKLLQKLSRQGLNVPSVISVEENKLNIEFIKGDKLRDVLTPEYCSDVGEFVKKMHALDVIHGDLTTSNILISDGKIWFIDFGLGFVSSKIEDKAVDLHLFKECLVSKHHPIWTKCWDLFATSYNDPEVLARLKIVEKRGKYKGE